MKKLYAFAAVACMAMTAFAQDGAPLYITGAGDFENGEWAPENPSELVYADGAYTIEINNLTQFKLSTVKGSWDEFNTAALTCDYGEVPGEVKELVAGDKNIACPWKGDYKVTVSGDLKTIILATETPGEVGPTILYLRGDMNGWGAEEAWALTEVEENLYKFEFAEGQEIAVGQAFKIADADWAKINIGGDGETVMLDTDTEVFGGDNPDNMMLEEAVNGVIWLILGYEDANYMWVSNDKESAPEWATSGVKNVEVAEGAVRYFNLQGVETVNPANGLYIVVRGNKATKEVVK